MSGTGMITIVAPLPVGKLDEAKALLAGWGNPVGTSLGNQDLAERLSTTGIHFMSGHALDLDGDARILLEISGDGSDAAILEALANAMPNELARLVVLSAGGPQQDIARYLGDNRTEIGTARGMTPGLPFRGVPGATVADIVRQNELAVAATALLAAQPAHRSALDRLNAVRAALPPAFDWVKATPPAAAAVPPARSTFDFVKLLAPGFVATFLDRALWLLLAFSAATATAHYLLWRPVLEQVGWFRVALTILAAFLIAILLGSIFMLGWIGSIVVRLTQLEAKDATDDRAPDFATNAAIFLKENRCAQNHMISLTTLKPGRVRRLTLRFAFWVIGGLATVKFRPGFLGDIGTIHFARWIAIPDSNRLVFLSNYGGSWESYLEDFITLASDGLTAIWSNTIGFPRTNFLFLKGATDGERFKRFARRSMVPTPFWYSAYPQLTTANIRTNAAIYRGLAAAQTEAEARDWLAHFGSAIRPAPKLETNEIQSLVFGGLGFLHNATMLLASLSDDVATARAWLADVTRHIAFNDGKRFDGHEVVTLAISARGFARLGLDAAARATFPLAFRTGMTGDGREQILGDTAANHKENWTWGGDGEPDVALIVFGPGTRKRRPALAATVEAGIIRHGGAVVAEIPLDYSFSGKSEPFGFADGVSQPVIRDTYRGLRGPDPLHVVEPGEFVLGYPDNRGNMPPGPEMDAQRDPENMLPLVDRPGDLSASVVNSPRAFASNGSYLVIRQLAQDVDGFAAYCDREAQRLRGRLGPPYRIDRDFVGAKLVGRWPNGSPLVRYPYDPDARPESPLQRAASNPPGGGGVIPSAQASGSAKPENDFLYGTEDPQALRCPYGAHIRRANPRDSLNPGSQDQINISNRHRILRVGRSYTDGNERGLMFMCLNGDIERQFEFVQQTWLGSPTFHGLSCEQDALLGSGAAACNGFTVPSHDGPIRLAGLPQFVSVKGGGYFFLPSLSLVRYLSGAHAAVQMENPLSPGTATVKRRRWLSRAK